ncbi:hypothetical protein NMY22_g18977 [Coprinellus aureogranulatus]|nr:hypothetical protein NMY22_g18977 [Coprinellus aureogranulatus]
MKFQVVAAVFVALFVQGLGVMAAPTSEIARDASPAAELGVVMDTFFIAKYHNAYGIHRASDRARRKILFHTTLSRIVKHRRYNAQRLLDRIMHPRAMDARLGKPLFATGRTE